MSSINWTNKVVWITGGSAGIGKAMALQLAKKNCKLILSARRVEAMEDVRTETGLSDEDCLILPMDLEQHESYDNLVQQAIDHFGHIDVLINNGGVSQRGLIEDTPLAVEKRIFNINYFGTISLVKSVLPVMKKQKNGSIAIISSVLGKFGVPGRATYVSSKHALQGYFEALAAEVIDYNIFVSILSPGFVHTDVSRNAITNDGTKHGKLDPGQAGGISPEKCATIIIHSITHKKRDVVIAKKEKLMIFIHNNFPRIYWRIIRNLQKKQKQEGVL